VTTTAKLARAVTVSTSALLLVSAAGCGGSDDSSLHPDNPGGVVISGVHESGPYFGAEPQRPYRMPDVTLTATNDQPFNLIRDTAYPVTLVFFGYTNCPDVCPLVMSDLTSTYLHLPKTLRSETQVLFITTDPARDTLATLRGYLARYDSSFVGLTGSLKDIVSAADGMGVAISGKHKLPSGGYDVGHGAQVIGFRNETAPVIWTGDTIGNVNDMVSDISRLAGS
jgi:protein SCO1/2